MQKQGLDYLLLDYAVTHTGTLLNKWFTQFFRETGAFIKMTTCKTQNRLNLSHNKRRTLSLYRVFTKSLLIS